jgi:parallel beta-helix repeat protein
VIIDVSTSNELLAAINSAQAGDTIVLADGTYALGGANCTASGTEAAPITVKGTSPLGADVDFDGLEGFRVTGAHWHFENLDVRGVCANDSDCEHAFHVSGAADGFVLRESRVRDFNAQLKVNADVIGTNRVMPNRGLVEYNEIYDTHGRATSNPVTKLNIDTGNDWIVRGNFIHDAYKMGGDGVSYATFMKSGGKRGIMERNLVVCSLATTGGTRIGLSFGGGGTAPQYCAPAYDASIPCSVEHEGGVMRNNIIANCSDVGIYLNRSKDTRVLFNTLVGTAGIDARFDTTSCEAVGNVLTSAARTRDNGTLMASSNVENISVATFQSWYQAPLAGDLHVIGDITGLVGTGPARNDVVNDYCGVLRPTSASSLGAIEHSVNPSCETVPPPHADDPMEPGGGSNDPGGGGDEPGDAGCCDSSGGASSLPLAIGVLLVGLRRRRR